MPGVEDWINGPLSVIQNLSDQNGQCDTTVIKDYFTQKLRTRNALSWIPSLNDTPLHDLQPNSLVRMRCMVQDMFDPEFYLGLYEVRDVTTRQTSMRCGKYKDIAECGPNQEINLESPRNVTMDRQTLYCIPVPGETQWVKETYSSLHKTKCQPSTSSTPCRTKRGLDEHTASSESSREAMETSQADINGSGAADRLTGSESVDVKRSRTDREKDSNSSTAHNLNFPLPGETGTPCLVKLYDDVDVYKVNDVVELVGVLSVDPSLAQFQGDGDSNDQIMSAMETPVEEMNAHAPPPSLVPRLHAVVCKRLSHVNPMLPYTTEDEEYKTVFTEMKTQVENLRSQLLAILQHCVFGDKLAAEYLLCHLVSTVYARVDVMPLGKFCLNLSNCPQTVEYSQLIYKLISSLVTKGSVDLTERQEEKNPSDDLLLQQYENEKKKQRRGCIKEY
ncbi:hypothetical protein ScPMuIL_006192 [Solemya velum]